MKSMREYGPDGSHFLTGNFYGLGHQFMSIGLKGHPEKPQPFRCSDSGLVVAMDGRISNRQTLLSLLGSKLPKDTPDFKILLELYKKTGEHSFKMTKGGYTAVIIDTKKQNLILARGPTGSHSLYYCYTENLIAFSSNATSLLSLKGFNFSIDLLSAASNYLNLLPTWSSSTLYKNLHSLKAAHSVTFPQTNLRESRFFEYKSVLNTNQLSINDTIEGLSSTITDSITPYLDGKYETACTLSGGLDSSSITGISALHSSSKKIHTISAIQRNILDPNTKEEIDCIQSVRDQFSELSHHAIPSDETGPFSDLRDHSENQDTPGCAITYMNRALCEQAANVGSRTLLTGFQSDMLASQKGFGILSELPRTSNLLQLFHYTLNNLKKYPHLIQGIRTELSAILGFAPFRPVLNRLKLNNIQSKISESILSEEFISKHELSKCLSEQLSTSFPHKGSHNRFIAEVLDLGCTNRSNLQGTITSGVEIHAPLGSQEVFEFCLSVPQEHFAFGEQPRGLFRKSMARYLPPKVRSRNLKAPFIPTFHANVRKEERIINELLEQIEPQNPIFEVVCREKFKATLNRALLDTDTYQSKNWDNSIMFSIYPTIAMALHFQRNRALINRF